MPQPKRATGCAAVLLLVLGAALGSRAAAAAPPPATAPATQPANAWDAYHAALDLAAQLPSEVADVLAKWRDVALEDKVATAIRATKPIDALLRQGAALERCDFGVLPADPWATEPSDALRLAVLATRLGLLRARWASSHDQPAEALAALDLVGRVARHIAQTELLVHHLAALYAETMRARWLGENLSRFDDAVLRAWRREGARAPALELSLRRALAADKREVIAVVHRAMLEQPDRFVQERRRGWEAAKTLGADPPVDWDGMLDLLKNAPAEARRQVDQVNGLWDRWIVVADLPPGEYDQQVEDLRAQVRGSGLVVRHAFPSVVVDPFSVRRVYDSARTTGAMLEAALALRLDGRAAFAGVHDPFFGRPFTLVEEDDHWEIVAAYAGPDRKPLSMRVPRRAGSP